MSNVTLTIAGRNYRVACAAGEEAHLAGLGSMIDSKLSAMEGTVGQTEARTLLFAALLLADELHEARSACDRALADCNDAGQLVEQFADRLENIVNRLEGQPPSP